MCLKGLKCGKLWPAVATPYVVHVTMAGPRFTYVIQIRTLLVNPFATLMATQMASLLQEIFALLAAALNIKTELIS